MKLQVAVDRVTLEHALALMDQIADWVDIVEVGTSLIKDYGMESVRQVRWRFPNVTVLADIKTMDEGAYEFAAAYAAGADIATVMGAASVGTVSACHKVAVQHQRDIMVDLLEISDHKIVQLGELHNVLYCVHLPIDGNQSGIEEKVNHFCATHPNLKRVAVAGGVTLTQLPFLKGLPIEVCVVGSAITKSKDPKSVASAFYNVVHA